ncbi:branched-chain amino acid ABC transporter permease [Chloroflexota bacterium]
MASDIMQFIFNGLSLSGFYAIFAIGLALVFGVMKLVNFAHGELFMFGAFTSWLVISYGEGLLPLPLLFILSLILAMLIVGGFGVVLERFLFKPLKYEIFSCYMATLQLMFVLQVVAAAIFGVHGRRVPSVFTGQLEIMDAVINYQRIASIIIAVILLTLLWLFLERTKTGRAIRASSQDAEAAALQGMSLSKMSMLVVGIGSALAAASAVIVANMFTIHPYMGATVIWKAFIVIIVGGAGSIGGAIVASVLFGFVDATIAALGEPQMVVMIDVLIMLIVLAFRPQGLLGREI